MSDSLTAARERHYAGPYSPTDQNGDPLCYGCLQPWPCDFALAIEALDECVAGKAEVSEHFHRMLQERDAAIEALDEMTAFAQNTARDNIMARAALAKWEASRDDPPDYTGTEDPGDEPGPWNEVR